MPQPHFVTRLPMRERRVRQRDMRGVGSVL
jgi:hypothetical protein